MFGGFGGGFPGGMGGGFGGFHEHASGGAHGSSEDSDDAGPSDTSKFYDMLGVAKDASQQQIKKAYRKKAMQLHPDKHPGEEEKYQAMFADLNRANEVLSDPDQRKLYDRYGESGLKGSASQSSMGDIFDMFFGGGGGGGMGGGRRRGRPRAKKAPPIKIPVDVVLEDLYVGASKKIHFKKFVLCRRCEGKGGSKVQECSTCDGRGQQTVMQMMGPMRIMQQRQCSACGGEGSMIRPGDKCKPCEGKGITEHEKDHTFTIPAGAKHADTVVLTGEGHALPGTTTGDVVCILRCAKHPLYQRVGADLIVNWKLSLKQALCGFTIRLPHFQRATLVLKSEPGEVMQHDTTKVIFTKGMPQKGAPHVHGNVYVKFEIKFPTELSEEIAANLGKVLPVDEESKEELDLRASIDGKRLRREVRDARASAMDEDSGDESSEEAIEIHEECELVDGEPTVTPASAKSAYDEDDEEEGPGCRHM